MPTMYQCRACLKEYKHRKRFLNHLINTKCGQIYENFGWNIDSVEDRRVTRHVKRKIRKQKVEAEEDESEEEKEEDMEAGVQEVVEVAVPKPEPERVEGDAPDFEWGGCGAKFNRKFTFCPECGAELEWE